MRLASRSGFDPLDVREDQAISDRLKNYLEKRNREDRTEAKAADIRPGGTVSHPFMSGGASQKRPDLPIDYNSNVFDNDVSD